MHSLFVGNSGENQQKLAVAVASAVEPAGSPGSRPAADAPSVVGGGLVPEALGQTRPSNTRVYVTQRGHGGSPLAFASGPAVRAGVSPAVHPGEGYVRLGVHWLEWVVADLERAKRLIRKFFVGDWHWYESPRGLNNRDRRLEGPWGIKIAFDVLADGPGNCYVVVPGQACEVLGVGACCEYLRTVPAQDWRRVDIAFDGWQNEAGEDVSPEWIREGLKAHADFVRSRIDRNTCVWKETGFSGENQTLYLGSRSSERFVCAYNERGFLRLELRLKGKFAQSFSAHLSAGLSVKKTSFGFLRDHIDFVVPGTSNITRAPLQTWWDRVVCRWDKCKASEAQQVASLDEKYEWLKRGVGATFVACLIACGADLSALEGVPVVGGILQAGQERFSARHTQLVASSPGWSPVEAREI